MQKQKKSILVLAIVAIFMAAGFFRPGQVGAGDLEPTDQPGPTMHTLEQILQAVTPLPTGFVLFDGNPRFAIWDNGTSNLSDDIVLDRSTGLMWVRDIGLSGTMDWQAAIDYCDALNHGNRFDWRLPTIEELVTLTEPYYHSPPFPDGHPFVNIPGGSYWSSTPVEGTSTLAWYVAWHGHVNSGSNSGVSLYVLPVRGGN